MKIYRVLRRIYHYLRGKYNINFNRIIFKNNNIIIGENWQINGKMAIKSHGNIFIGKNFKANSSKYDNPIGGDTLMRFVVGKNATLTIGSNVGISNSTIVCRNKVSIGNYAYIGGDCRIWDTDFHSIDPRKRIDKDDINAKSKAITILKYAFIGGGSIILKGVTIGENSIVGAGSVVTKSIPNNEIWAGNPAKFIKKHPNKISII